MIAICEKMSGHDRNHAIHAIRCIIESNNHSILQLWQNKESLEQLNIQLGSVMKILTKEHELYASELKEWQCAKCHYLGLNRPYKNLGRPKKISIKGFN